MEAGRATDIQRVLGVGGEGGREGGVRSTRWSRRFAGPRDEPCRAAEAEDRKYVDLNRCT